VWFSTWDGGAGNTDDPVAIAVSPDGSKVFATGSTTAIGFTNDYPTVAWDAATGARLWAQVYDGPYGGGFDSATALAAAPDGSAVFVTGFSQSSSGDDDEATIAYDASTGSQRWIERFDDGHHQEDLAKSIAVTPDGSQVFVTGSSYYSSPNWNDYVTVNYAAGDGTALGVADYDGRMQQEDIPSAVVVSPDGSKVFVTGYSQELYGSSYDYATVAYQASA
jgi:DNA-binding beta-propeller fold protein YncE